MQNNISIVISTYQRVKKLTLVLESLINQKENFFLDIIIVDSFSQDGSKVAIDNYKTKNNFDFINYYNIEENILSSKRNFGLKKAKYNKVILLDDDCIPKKNFLDIFTSDLNDIDEYTILSGVVTYPEEYLKNSPYLRFRQSTHFQESKVNKNIELNTKNFVAMNMALNIGTNNKKDILFDEKFVGYGFEDYEFAYRLKKKGYSLKQSKASIIHNEGIPDLEMYLKKYYHLGRDGMKNFLKIDENAAKTTIYYKIETNLFLTLLLNIFTRDLLFNNLFKLLTYLNNKNIFNLGILINFFRMMFYFKGFKNRFSKNLDIKNRNWYE